MLSATPNGLAVLGSLFLLGGFAIIGASMFGKTLLVKYPQSSFIGAGKSYAAAAFALPIIGAGFFLQAAGNLVPIAIGPGLSMLALALAFSLLMFLMMDETIADAATHVATVRTSEPKISLLPPPTLDLAEKAVLAKSEPSALDLAG